mgnify:CR=1 FL=1
MKAVIDWREKPSGIVDLMIAGGVDVQVKKIACGDFILDGVVTVERKTAGDFIVSIIDGRLFRQVANLKKNCDHPVLLIDGERELEEDKLYLQAYYEAMAEPKDYYTLSGSDHYSNVAHIGPWAVYDKEVVDETVTVLDDWMTRILQESPSS